MFINLKVVKMTARYYKAYSKKADHKNFNIQTLAIKLA